MADFEALASPTPGAGSVHAISVRHIAVDDTNNDNGANGERSWRRHGSIPNRDAALPASVAMWDRYMEPKYADISIEDLVGENYLALFTDFCSKMGENPPMKPNGSAYGILSLTKYVRHLILDMRQRFGNNDAIKNGTPFFADNDASQMLRTLDSHHG